MFYTLIVRKLTTNSKVRVVHEETLRKIHCSESAFISLKESEYRTFSTVQTLNIRIESSVL